MERQKRYLKTNIFQISQGKIIDFRKSTVVDAKTEQRRMFREKIPPHPTKIGHVGMFWHTEPLPQRCLNRLTTLLTFFTPERIEKMLVPIISVSSRISLRALDWFVINYAKKHKVVLVNSHSHITNVYDDYRAWLKYWKRDLFDAFRRGTRIYFDHAKYTYSTTCAQLNFLFFADRVGVLQYANHNISTLETDMNTRIAQCRSEKSKFKKVGAKRKRCELSRPPSVKCLIYYIPCTLQFQSHPK